MDCNYSSLRLSTARLNLRPLATGDADELFAIHSDPEFMRYWCALPWTSLDQAKDDDIASDIKAMAANDRYIGLGVFLRESNRLIGVCTIRGIDRQHRRAELGFGISKDYWHKGFMYEAVSAIIQFSFDDLNLRRLEAEIDPRNIASCKLAEKLGFVLEGIQRERWCDTVEITDSAMYGLLSREWRNQFGQ
jgi:RimJ/RimL family protein N-acetyltransferase